MRVAAGAVRGEVLDNLLVGTGGLDTRGDLVSLRNTEARSADFADVSQMDFHLRDGSRLVGTVGNVVQFPAGWSDSEREYVHLAVSRSLGQFRILSALSLERFRGSLARLGTKKGVCVKLNGHSAEEIGSSTRARTWDLRINSPSLYRLSYRGREWARIICDASSLQDRSDRLRHVVHVTAVQRGDTNAPGVHRVDVKLFAQAVDLLRGQSAVREHSVLPQHE